MVRADPEQLTKAVGYLVRFLAHRVEADGRVAIHLQTVPDDASRVRLSLTGRPAELSALEREHLFSPLAIASDRLLDVGPGGEPEDHRGPGGATSPWPPRMGRSASS